MRPAVLALALAAFCACHSPKTPATSVSIAARTRAPWLEPPRTSFVTSASLNPLGIVDALHGIALVHTDHGPVVVDSTDGISGLYQLGEIEDATFTADRTLYVLHPDGALDRWSYRSGVGLSAGTQLASVANVSSLVSGSTVVATWTNDAVLLSSDRGESFGSTRFADETIERVLVRADDAIVVQSSGKRGLVTRLSTDRGKSFHETVRVPLLERLGGLIYGHDQSCGFTPKWPVLSANGTFLAAAANPASIPYADRKTNLHRWFAKSALATERPDDPMPWASDLETPTDGSPTYAGYPLCDPPTGHTHPHRHTKLAKMIETRSEDPTFECTGVACVTNTRMRAPPPTRTRAYLLNDGPRHAVFLDDDAEAARILALPTDCAPRFLTYAGGLVVLACKDALFASTADARWAERFTLGGEFALQDFEMASDGTAMFAHYGDGASRAIVRAPVALGANAWRDVTHPSALAYALRDGGGVDVIIGDGDLLTVIDDTPLARKHVLTRVAVGDLWCIGRKDGRIVGIRRKPSMTFERIILEPRGVIVDSPLLDGSGATDPTGACGF